MNILMSNKEETDKKDIILKIKRRGQIFEEKKKLQKGICLNDTKKYGFPQRNMDIWNGQKEEVIIAKNVHQLKEKQDKYRYRDKTT